MDEFQFLPEFFVLMYDLIMGAVGCELFLYVVVALTVYGIICLFWSFVLDD